MDRQVQLTLEGDSAIKNELCGFCGEPWDGDATQKYRDYLTRLGTTIARCPICEMAFVCFVYSSKLKDPLRLARKMLEDWTHNGSFDEVKDALEEYGIDTDP